VKSDGYSVKPPLRLASGINGLDRVLCGGLITGSVYIVQGTPGAGKTIFANQLAFTQAAQGKRALYITLLAESHDRLMGHLSQLRFYDQRYVADALYYVSGFHDLQNKGLMGILQLLGKETKARPASLIVLDGLFVVEETAGNEAEYRKFINDIAMFASLTNSTILLLTNSERGRGSPEFTMVDGWLELALERTGHRTFRYLEVHKFRGSEMISGRHMAIISDAGMEVLPRLEAVSKGRSDSPFDEVERLSSGIPALDDMLGGGVPAGSSTLLLGASGIGKTTLGLQFISGATPEEPALIFGFYENAQRLRKKARLLGMDFDSMIADGSLEILWQPATENLLDQLAYRLLEAVRRRKVKRLLVDGLDGVRQSVILPERLSPYLAALANTLRDEAATTMFTAEQPYFLNQDGNFTLDASSSVAENIILMRYVEHDSYLQRCLSVVKVRESDFDHAIRSFTINSNGIELGDVVAHGLFAASTSGSRPAAG
jgi:circadian clock protein KaiC